MSSGWEQFAKENEPEVSYAPLTLEAIPQIQAQAAANLRNVVPESTGFRAQCPFHVSSSGDSMTLRVNLDPSSHLGIGFFKCYRCLQKGHWNKLTTHVGIDPLTGDANPEIKNLLMPVKVTYDQYRLPFNMVDWPGKPWRRFNKNNGTTTVISPYAFEVLGAKLWRLEAEVKKAFDFKGVHYPVGSRIPETRAWLPVLDNLNTPMAHVAALLSERYPGSKKYLNSFGAWSKKYIAFVQQLRPMGLRRIVLVEGAADAMRLIDRNIPASPLNGVGTWTDLKTEVLAGDYQTAIVCLDGDGAGQPAQEAVAASLRKMMSVHTIQMPRGEDPASLPEDKFKQLVQTILSKG